LPFEEQNKERLERRIRSAIPPPPLPPSCPEPLSRVVMKMLARDQSRRYGAATEVKEDLLRFTRGEPVLAAVLPPPLPNTGYESEETVRTTAPSRAGDGSVNAQEDDRTVRTDPRIDSGRPAGPPPAPSRIVWPPKKGRSRGAMGCLIAIGVVCFAGLIFFLTQVSFYKEANKLKSDLQTERLTDLNDAWTRYQALANRTHFGFLLWGAANALKKRLVAAADDIILDYRNNDAPSVYEPQWAQAKAELHHALEIDPNDNGVKGRYRLCEGHLDRIAGGRLRGLARQHMLNTAVAKFDEAADLERKSPDPYLGLARLYVYDMPDLDKAEQALNKAAEYGHPMGKRETAQLADGYLRRGDRFFREAEGMTGAVDQEREYLQKASQDYLHAQDLYDRSGLFGDAPRNKLRAIQGQQKVEERLSELEAAQTAGVPLLK
jgi:tetratricopeptide (TPR) repeat protein